MITIKAFHKDKKGLYTSLFRLCCKAYNAFINK